MRGSDFGRKTSGHALPFVMGILNVTPDSFSDGGLYLDTDAAVEHAFRMIDEGAEIIDIGAESTRPGFTYVSPEEEIARLVPVIRRVVASCDIPVSVDTYKSCVARAAVEAGAHIINDVNGLRGEGMAEYAAEAGVPVMIMHMQGAPSDTHACTVSGDVISVISDFFDTAVSSALDAGIRRDNIILDPGIGFGKTMEQNASIIRNLDRLCRDLPMLVGTSRKRVLSYMYPDMDRDEATVRASITMARKGADIIRVHNVGMMCEALQNTNL